MNYVITIFTIIAVLFIFIASYVLDKEENEK
jgi:hypothetical protein